MTSKWGALQSGPNGPDEEAGAGDDRPVLVVLDEAAHAAVLPDAACLARCLGGSLLLAHVMPPGSSGERVHGVRQRFERLVRSARAQGVRAAAVLLEGDPTEQIVGYVTGNGIAALALGSRGDWLNDGGLHGSVADAILRRSPVPVLVRRAPAQRTPAEAPAFRRLLVPLDGSRLAERALPDAIVLARAGGGQVLLLQAVGAVRPFGGGSGELVARELQAAGEYLTAIRERYWRAGVPIEVTVRLGRPAEVIRWVGRETAADLVVMATHGRSGLRREQLGSVALDVLQGELPLLLRSPAAVRPWAEQPPALLGISGDHSVAV